MHERKSPFCMASRFSLNCTQPYSSELHFY